MIATREPAVDGVLVAGVDVGGTKTSVVVTDDRDRVLYERVAPTDRESLVDEWCRDPPGVRRRPLRHRLVLRPRLLSKV